MDILIQDIKNRAANEYVIQAMKLDAQASQMVDRPNVQTELLFAANSLRRAAAALRSTAAAVTRTGDGRATLGKGSSIALPIV